MYDLRPSLGAAPRILGGHLQSLPSSIARPALPPSGEIAKNFISCPSVFFFFMEEGETRGSFEDNFLFRLRTKRFLFAG